MVFCSKCGSQIAAGASFCPGCGGPGPGAAADAAAAPTYRNNNDASSTTIDYGPGYTGGYAKRRTGSAGVRKAKVEAPPVDAVIQVRVCKRATPVCHPLCVMVCECSTA